MSKWVPAWPAGGSPTVVPEIVGMDTAQAPHGETFRVRLRRDTQDAHRRLDASFEKLGEGDATDYAVFIRVNEACLRAIEPILVGLPLPATPEWRFEPRHASAAADLSALELASLDEDTFPLTRPSVAQGIGVAYVLEGSRLGGRLILRALRRASDASMPVSFLETADRTDHFRFFLAMAEANVTDARERNEAINAANMTFGYFLDAVRTATRGRATGDTI